MSIAPSAVVTASPTKPSRPFESVAGLWKLLCALAVLVGHNLVSLTALRPHDPVWAGLYHLVQFFSPLHFFFFSGYLAASGLLDLARPMKAMMVGRGLRVYVLVVAALAWGLSMRLAIKHWAGVPSLGDVWPLGVWDGPVEPSQVLRHLNPFGFADHVQFDYATWYLYQELRIVLLFPLFRWVLLRRSSISRWAIAAGLLVAAAGLEYRFWSFFPMFRSSPFQSLAYGVMFLSGALVWMELRPGGWFSRISRPVGFGLLLAGVGLSFLESMGIRPHLSNPPVLLVPTMVGQILVVTGLLRTVGNFAVPAWLRRACDWSVGIYIVHPPLHVLALWLAIGAGTLWPLAAGIAVSLLGGVLFHLGIEAPSQGWIKRIQDRIRG